MQPSEFPYIIFQDNFSMDFEAFFKNRNSILAWILKNFSLSCKSTCNWETNLVATTLASGVKNKPSCYHTCNRGTKGVTTLATETKKEIRG
jgi:hypothetical protein